MIKSIPHVLSIILLIVSSIRADEPVLADGQITYPSNARIPRWATSFERDQTAPEDSPDMRTVTAAPTGPLRTAADYEPVEAMVLSWKGDPSWQNILALMTANITTIGNADVYIAVNNAAEQSNATANLIAHGV